MLALVGSTAACHVVSHHPTAMAKVANTARKQPIRAAPLSVSMGWGRCELGSQSLYRSMAEQFASGQMLHLHHKLAFRLERQSLHSSNKN
jgi:hypothetical protein